MKKMLLMAFMVCLSVLAFADEKTKTSKEKSAKDTVIVSIEMEEFVKAMVAEESDSLLNDIQASFKLDAYQSAYKRAEKKIKHLPAVNAFIYSTDSTKLAGLIGCEPNKLPNKNLSEVMSRLVNRDYYQNSFCFENISVGKPELVEVIRSKFTFNVPVTFSDRNIAKDKKVAETPIVDVKYKTTLLWNIKVEEVKENVTDENGQQIEKVSYEVLNPNRKFKPISCELVSLNYLPSEKSEMCEIAKKEIESWYANLYTNLDVAKLGKESQESLNDAKIDVLQLTEAINKSDVEVKGNNMDYTTRTYTWKAKDEERVTVAVNPMNFIEKEEEYLYDLETVSASLTFTPQFTVVLTAEPYKVESFDVQYTDYTIAKPITEVEKANRNELAGEFIGNYISSLEAYAAGDKATRESLRPEVEAMFADGAKIEVSYFPKGGNDRKIEREVSNYLTLLKDADLDVIEIERTKTAPNVVSVEYRLTQSFAGKKYSDKVKKDVKMEYKDGRWVIIGITIYGPTERL